MSRPANIAGSHCRQSLMVVLGLALAAPSPGPAVALDANLIEQTLTAVGSHLTSLDRLAEGCLQSASRTTPANDPCREFIQALDGDALSRYLEHCGVLKSWRDAMAEASVDPDAVVVDDAATTLRQLMNVEYYCGENALLKRTRFVQDAYEKSVRPGTGSGADYRSLTRQLLEMRQDELMEAQRLRLLQSLQDLQGRQQQESRQLQNRQELELLRQQQNRGVNQ